MAAMSNPVMERAAGLQPFRPWFQDRLFDLIILYWDTNQGRLRALTGLMVGPALRGVAKACDPSFRAILRRLALPLVAISRNHG